MFKIEIHLHHSNLYNVPHVCIKKWNNPTKKWYMKGKFIEWITIDVSLRKVGIIIRYKTITR